MRDPYTVLGVTKGASSADIKKAYRRLAKQYHPDQSTDAKAKDRFAEVGAAYEILGDEKKRGSFDRGEIDAEGKPKFHGFEGFAGSGGQGRGFEGFEFNFGAGGAPRGRGGGGFDTSDIFSDLFGGGARGSARPGGFGAQSTRGEDVHAELQVSLSDSVHGARARVALPTGRELEVAVPAGIEDGKQIRLKGQGHAGARGGSTGDVLITVRVAKHPFFRVEGHDLRLDLPITLYEAVLGGKVNVPTLEGKVELNVPAGTDGSRTLRLRGKGLPTAKGARGDLLVALRIVLPGDAATVLGDAARTMADSKPYDPRKALG